MNNFFKLAATAVVTGALLLAGCSSDKSASSAPAKDTKEVTLKVGATPVPHAEILQQIIPILAKEGVKLQIVEFSDYVLPNTALADKELDANFFQHVPYLEKFNAEHKTDLIATTKVHVEPMGVYSHSIKSLTELQNGAKVAIPNDPTNGGRALLLLQKEGVIKLKEGGTVSSTVADITDNAKNLQIVELDAAQLPRSLDDVTAAVINTNYALEASLNPLKDAIAIESQDSPYANVLVIRKDEANNDAIKKLQAALNSPEVKKFIQEKYNGAIIPAF